MSARFLRLARVLSPGEPDWVARAVALCIGGVLLGVGLGALGVRRGDGAGEVPAVVAVLSVLGFGLALVSLGSIFAVAAVKKVRSGRSDSYFPEPSGTSQTVTRAEAPGAFWFDVVLCGLLAAALYVAALALVVAAAAAMLAA